jgi:hypothetical protein
MRKLLLVLLVACGSTVPTPAMTNREGMQVPDYVSKAASDGVPFSEMPPLERLDLSQLKPAQATDYIDVRKRAYGEPPILLSKTGTPCAGATDQSLCQATLNAVWPNGGGLLRASLVTTVTFLAFTRGDQAFAAAATNEVVALVGNVDAQQEAALVAASLNYRARKSRAIDGGFEIEATKIVNDCPLTENRFILRVATDGSVTIELSELESEADGCI